MVPQDPRTESGDSDRAYQTVRSKLIERGYLHGPIERFVLDDLLHTAGPTRMVRTALRAAAVGGALLGALLAGAAATAHRPLLGAADLPLLWFYFTAVSGAALFVLDLGAAAAVTALARRRGARSTDALRAAAIVGGPTLVYLWLVWLAHRPGAGWLGDAVFLVAAVGTTLLVAWLAGLVSLVDVIGSTGQVPDRIRRPLFVVLLAVAALAAGIVVTRVGATGAAVEAAPFETQSVASDLLFIGIDGLDLDLIATAGEGSLPALRAAMAAGASFPLERPAGIEPPEAWTTLITGAAAQEHRVRSAGSERLPGVATPLGAGGSSPLGAALRFLLPTRTVPASGVGRRVRNLPEMLGLRRETAAIGWWATWPAVVPEAGGFVVSDRVLSKLLSGAPADRDTAPGSLFHRLAADFETTRAALRERFEVRFGPRFEDNADGPVQRLVWESYLIDAWGWRITERLAASDVRATFVYLPGLDILRHRLAASGATAADADAAVQGYLEWLDERVGEITRGDLDGRTVVLVGDRGRHGSGQGVVLVLGAGAVPACHGDELSLLDVTPLVLDLRGFPRSREMAGAAPDRCLELPGPAGTVVDYGRRPVQRGSVASAFDAEMVERLRSLGYLN